MFFIFINLQPQYYRIFLTKKVYEVAPDIEPPIIAIIIATTTATFLTVTHCSGDNP